jgi:predicted ATPase
VALFVIVGPPASGKTTWVRERAKRGDVVIDLDAIATALTVDGDGHNHPTPVLRCAQRARSVVIDEALKHCAELDVYVVHTAPSAKALARYAGHGAHVVTVDPGREVVEARVAEQRTHTTRAVVARWYAEHGDAAPREEITGSRSW